MMNSLLVEISQLLLNGINNLVTYLAAHVLLCLLPAFLVAGAMTAFIPPQIITRYLGRNTLKIISYPAAAVAGFLLAVCSCTVMPLFAGIYKKGAGLGPSITFLFVAPAVNILAISYTGALIGQELAFARLILSIVFGIGIGIIMAMLFQKEDVKHVQEADGLFAGRTSMNSNALLFLLVLIALLILGTWQIDFLKGSYLTINLPITGLDRIQDTLLRLIQYDATRGEEGLSVHGMSLIIMLFLLGMTAWKGIEKIQEGFNAWTWVTVGLFFFTLILAAAELSPIQEGLIIQITGKMIGVIICILILVWLLKFSLSSQQIQDFLWESWKFIKQIFPLLLVGVFMVGVIRGLIKPAWIESLAGSNNFVGNFVAVLFGVFMYFPTLVEVPIARMFLELGMHRGPLLAYLMADPELSLQSILVTSSIIGKKKTWVYVGFVALFSVLAGLLFGAWING